MFAWQTVVLGAEHVMWEHRDPSNASFRTTNENGSLNDQTYVGEGAPAELDPTGANADLFDPYLYEPPPEENFDSLMPYPSFGGASTFGTTYSWDGIRMPADELFETVNTLLHGRFGIAHAIEHGTRFSGTRTVTQRWRVQPIGDELSAVAGIPPPAPYLITISYVFPLSGTDPAAMELLGALPQNRGFQIGRFGFPQDKLARLARAYDKVTSSACETFFNDAISALIRKGELSPDRNRPSSLQGVLGIATLNLYDSSLTARQVGETNAVWSDVKDKFDNYQSGGAGQRSGYGFGVTIRQNRIFLPDRAFYQTANIFSQMLYKDADLSGIIVHELFHVAGLNEKQVTALGADIQKYCGIPGFAGVSQ